MAQDEWFSFEEEGQLGPFTREQLLARLARAAPGALVWRNGMAGWLRPGEVPELAWPQPPPFTAAFQALAKDYGAEARTDGEALTFETTQDGVRTTLRCVPDSDDATLEITVGGPHPHLTVFLEGGLERLGKRLRLNREVQTGDDDFDRRVYLNTPLPAPAVRDIAGRPGFRRGVLTLLEQGFGAVHLDDEGLSVSKDVEHADELARPRIDPVLAALLLVTTSLRGIDPAWSRHRRSDWPLWLAGGAALAAVVGVVGVLVAYGVWEPASIGLVLLGLLGGGLLWVASVAVLIALLRGRSDALFHLALSGTLLLAALPSLTAAGLVASNGALDGSLPVERQTVVQGKATVTGRRLLRMSRFKGRYYHTHHVLVRDGRRLRTVSVSKSTHDRVQRGSPLTIVTRRGALGWDWDEHAR